MQGPLPLMTAGSGCPNAWEAEVALGGAKLFLIGSPYASDFCFSDIAGGPLQVQHAIGAMTFPQFAVLRTYSYTWLSLATLI